ncbi:MAG: hypothetical protein RR749_17850, partial [Comamonas sp.]
MLMWHGQAQQASIAQQRFFMSCVAALAIPRNRGFFESGENVFEGAREHEETIKNLKKPGLPSVADGAVFQQRRFQRNRAHTVVESLLLLAAGAPLPQALLQPLGRLLIFAAQRDVGLRIGCKVLAQPGIKAPGWLRQQTGDDGRRIGQQIASAGQKVADGVNG